MHLLFAPFGAGVVLVEARKFAVIAFVECLLADCGERGLAEFAEDQTAGMLRAGEIGGEGDVEGEAEGFEALARGFRLANAFLGEVGIFPAGEEIFEVPVTLAVTDKYKQTIHRFLPISSGQISPRPSTSIIE